jgi:shikimate dehydrogenase
MRQFGIIGYPLTHSFSPAYFNEKFAREQIAANYQALPITNIEQLPNILIQNPLLCGFNVTIPYKTTIIPYLHSISEDARQIDAVNCVKIIEGKMYGYNTDHIGFTESLRPLINQQHYKALILGNGGSAQAVKFALQQFNIEYLIVTRKKSPHTISYQQVDRNIIQQHNLIINTTPQGMYPNVDECPLIPYQYIGAQHLLFDLIYNPAETLFLRKGKQQNAAVKNGMEMLLLQAEKGWEIWNLVQ